MRPSIEDMLERERIANRRKHWVRAVTACNSRCLFCLDSDTPRNVHLPEEEVQRELRRGRDELDADKVIISGGEASLHPRFFDLIRYAKSIGYDRVQTVTNGWHFAEKAFYDEARDAGLGEITFSLHGHTPELHDALTRHKGSYHRLMKGLIRAIRDPKGPIVNVDVVINKQNVGVLDKIVELAISVGVTEFDLLHVIPQAAAFDHREALFYDVREHMDVLHKVFRLNRHKRFVIWTNRFPVSYLEGLEDLIQDPHKMLDEVNGRRWQVRRYLDVGQALDCRQPERCVHCFIEPYCTTQDRVIADLREQRWDVWQQDPRAELPGERAGTPILPFGCRWLGVEVGGMDDLAAIGAPEGCGVEARVGRPGPLPARLQAPLRLIADTAEACESFVGPASSPAEVEIWLNRETAAWMMANRDRLAGVRVHQPSYEHMSEASENDVRDPAAFFRDLGVRLPVSGLPACLAPGMALVASIRRLPSTLFEGGRLDIRELARFHVREGYTARSERCRDCRLADRCDGAHVNWIRVQGLARLQPLTEGAWADDADAQLKARWPEPEKRLRDGRPVEAPHRSLPGFPEPEGAPADPLAVIALEQQKKRAERVAKAMAEKG
jgi:MoaA/NifB/PqqE/SkfB family radical SAM enzyme